MTGRNTDVKDNSDKSSEGGEEQIRKK
jgi:hypothetical protein